MSFPNNCSNGAPKHKKRTLPPISFPISNDTVHEYPPGNWICPAGYAKGVK